MSSPLKTVPAAQYLRMSTDHQSYSLESQRSAIAEYALNRGFDIVRTYEDAGKSGVSLKGRTALTQLLSDVLAPDRPFDAVLAFDVSRFGRFQDPDEAAHYEFICRRAGVTIAYCQDCFENDNSLSSNIIKSLKRMMAGEYSRDLSARLSRAHRCQAELGFRQGGTVPFGFRRQLIDRNGKLKGILEPGETKALNSDRVLVIAGPKDERETIKRIFHLYTNRNYSFRAIANKLNKEGVSGNYGQKWSLYKVKRVLKNELCIGKLTYAKTTSRLQMRRRQNPDKFWVRVDVVDPIVSEHMFHSAQRRISRRGGTMKPEVVLNALRGMLLKHGYLSAALIRQSKSVPDLATFRRYFGKLSNAYKEIGYSPPLHECYWSEEAMIESLKRAYAKRGYITSRLIDSDPELPSVTHLKLKFGSLMSAYALAGFPQRTAYELRELGRLRHEAGTADLPQHSQPKRRGQLRGR